MITCGENQCVICKRVFWLDDKFRSKHPHANETFCGRASCMRANAKKPLGSQFKLESPRRSHSFTKDSTVAKHPISGFKEFDRRRRIAVQKLLNRQAEDGERLLMELLHDMLSNGIGEKEFRARKIVFDEWLHNANNDGRIKAGSSYNEDPNITSSISRLYDVLNNAPQPSEYKTRSVWRKGVA